MPDPLQDVPAEIRGRLEIVAAKLPSGWVLVEITHNSLGWTARFADEEGNTTAHISVLDPPAEAFDPAAPWGCDQG